MKRQAFQYGEIRDEYDNIIQEGSYGKGTAFATADNTGIIDYMMNNFQALFDIMSSAAVYADTKANLPAVGDGGKLYITKDDGKSWRWDGKVYVELSTSVDGASAYEIAVQNGFNGTEQEWLASLGSDTVVSGSVDDDGNLVLHLKGGGNITTPLQPLIDAKAYRDAAKASQDAAKTSETNAGNSATMAQGWAESTDSPDGKADTDSTTKKTQSSKSWALFAKDRAVASDTSAQASKASQDAAKTSETNAKASEEASKASETASQTSANNASASETNAATSATNAKQSETNAKASADRAQQIKESIGSVYKACGSLPMYDDLPTSGMEVGDVYNILTADPSNNINAGDNVAWNGTEWDNLSGIVDLSSYATTASVDDKNTAVKNEVKATYETIEDANGLVKSVTEDNGTVTVTTKGGTSNTFHAGVNILERNKTYAVGDIAYSPNLPSWAYLECVTAGTTGDTEPDFTNVSTGGGTN